MLGIEAGLGGLALERMAKQHATASLDVMGAKLDLVQARIAVTMVPKLDLSAHTQMLEMLDPGMDLLNHFALNLEMSETPFVVIHCRESRRCGHA